MMACKHELVAIASTAQASELQVPAPVALTMEELAYTPRYDIRTAAGATLWQCIILADIPRIIQLRRELPELYPEWQQDLVAHPLDEVPSAREVHGAAINPEGLTLAALNGICEPLRYCGGNLGLGFDTIDIYVRTPTRSAHISLEQALRHLDLFDDETRWRLVVGVEYWFDCKLERGVV